MMRKAIVAGLLALTGPALGQISGAIALPKGAFRCQFELVEGKAGQIACEDRRRGVPIALHGSVLLTQRGWSGRLLCVAKSEICDSVSDPIYLEAAIDNAHTGATIACDRIWSNTVMCY